VGNPLQKILHGEVTATALDFAGDVVVGVAHMKMHNEMGDHISFGTSNYLVGWFFINKSKNVYILMINAATVKVINKRH
jgi:hypothetical protein